MNITLALGSGGIYNFTYIGVIRILEEEGICICGIAGTSAGGIYFAIPWI